VENLMKKLLFALGVALWLCAPAHAQVASAYTVSACGAQSNPAGQPFPLTMDLTGNLCGSISNTSAAPLYVAGAPYSYTALGCQQITSLASAAPFASIPTGAKLATVTPEVQPVRYRDDGTAPTASIGPLLYPGLVWSYSGPLASIQFIQTAASATIDVCFYK
jgi:hypothetical protein